MRPTKYEDDFPDRLIAHMSEGLSFETFAATVDVTPRTLYNWSDPEKPNFIPEFFHAKNKAFAHSALKWEKAGITFATGSKDAYEILVGADGTERLQAKPFNGPVWIYNMKCRFRRYGWNEHDTSSEVARFRDPPIDESLTIEEPQAG